MAEKKQHIVLYRKYRPQNFEEVIGQEHITEVLKKAVASNKINHAYLFSGSRGTGKTSVARILAKAINCQKSILSESDSDDPNKLFNLCGKCDTCQEITAGNSLDLVEIDAASNRGIDEIRVLREAVNLSPLKNKYKVYIIDECHTLTKEAFNALLKTLEEPPAHAIFILATTEFEKLPETIISRTQHFKFKKPSERAIKESLQNIAKKEKVIIDNEALDTLSLFADGSFRDAHVMMDQAFSFNDKKLTGETVRNFFGAPSSSLVKDFLSSLFERDAAKGFKIINNIFEQNLDMRLFLKLILRDLRFMMILNMAPAMEAEIEKITGKEKLEELKLEKNRANNEQYEFMLNAFLEAYMSTAYSYFPQLPLELAVAKIIGNTVD